MLLVVIQCYLNISAFVGLRAPVAGRRGFDPCPTFHSNKSHRPN